MSERKAINKYYPPDWDPSKVPKKKKNTNPNAEKVRLMVPFSMKCLQCQEYISARRKFNARKEITSEKYMGIKIIRFHIKCPRCNYSLLFQTDPKTAGFIPVAGCARNYESLSATETVKPLETEEEIFERLEKQEKEDQDFQEQQKRRKNNPFWLRQTQDSSKDAMSNLEDKLIEQKREQEVHDHLMYLQAKATKLQQSGGQDGLVSQAQEKIRLDLKREREQDEESAKNTLQKSQTTSIPLRKIAHAKCEIKIPLLTAGRFTSRKTDFPSVTSHDSGHVPGNVSALTAVEHSEIAKKPEIEMTADPKSVFGDYGSSDEE
ncbi:hypothetical protein HF325_003467 [Metschnikowia pulcherrima]|uniref:Splicing factor YJU2 n=1 Tax=Metschnikowia pulcherrima TaxID=27326 RepID=A0A8H7LEZ0_9ASCO|nr:hypothetical protein HF325_003467 [Metschnikowia pulcherrima]